MRIHGKHLTIHLHLRALGLISRGKFDMDVVGHYGRPDIFQLKGNRTDVKPVSSFVVDENMEEEV